MFTSQNESELRAIKFILQFQWLVLAVLFSKISQEYPRSPSVLPVCLFDISYINTLGRNAPKLDSWSWSPGWYIMRSFVDLWLNTHGNTARRFSIDRNIEIEYMGIAWWSAMLSSLTVDKHSYTQILGRGEFRHPDNRLSLTKCSALPISRGLFSHNNSR